MLSDEYQLKRDPLECRCILQRESLLQEKAEEKADVYVFAVSVSRMMMMIQILVGRQYLWVQQSLENE